MASGSDIKLDDIKNYWEKSPICDYEVKEERFSRAYYDKVDEINLKNNNPFNLHLFRFGHCKDKKVLDVGCGAGFLVRQYARHGADICGLDITEISVIRTKRSLDMFNLKGSVIRGDAGRLPFKDGMFDFVTSWGVLHHIPSTEKGIQEAYRVLRADGKAIISLYYRNILLRRPFFHVLKLVLKLILRAPKERSGLQDASTPEEFVRMYDGKNNPLGRVFTKSEILKMFADFRTVKLEQHGVPTRFLLGGKSLPRPIHRMIDGIFGICLCVEASK